VQPVKTGDNHAWYSAFGVIKSKHADFVVCDPETMEFRLVVELDDKSHERNDRAERDQMVDDILAQANIPVLHIPAKASYSLEEIRRRIFGDPAAVVKP
jgi:very-short-patch-repair endonuclease